MEEEYSVSVTQLIQKMNLINHTPEIDTDHILIKDPNMNRPAVQLAGFFEHFDSARIQICGNVELGGSGDDSAWTSSCIG